MNDYYNKCLSIGLKIKQLIKESDYKTQEEFAFQFGVDVRTVGRWVRMGVDSISTLYQIADFFHIPLSDLIE